MIVERDEAERLITILEAFVQGQPLEFSEKESNRWRLDEENELDLSFKYRLHKGAVNKNIRLLDGKQKVALGDAAEPLMIFLNENCNPHCFVIVEANTVELVEGICIRKNNEFLKD